jgi:4-deoxy-L-threo-5-hexosulose-uronate ketol-isomerase
LEFKQSLEVIFALVHHKNRKTTNNEESMKTRFTADPARYRTMTTGQIREAFLIDDLSVRGEIHQVYIDLDRAVVGMAVPLKNRIALTADDTLRAKSFTERREVGVLNTGGSGMVHVGSETYPLASLDCLYVGRGANEITFESANPDSPAAFYLLSYPAHSNYPTALIHKADASLVELGSVEMCNRRTVCKYIRLDGARSCQLVMGVTHLHPGSAWNTMPAHTHMRRSEIYMYFNLAADARVFHLMGPPEETRHIVMKNGDVVVSPGWSIHAGVGTQAYSFCWGMGGENQDYGDMDPVPIQTLQ